MKCCAALFAMPLILFWFTPCIWTPESLYNFVHIPHAAMAQPGFTSRMKYGDLPKRWVHWPPRVFWQIVLTASFKFFSSLRWPAKPGVGFFFMYLWRNLASSRGVLIPFRDGYFANRDAKKFLMCFKLSIGPSAVHCTLCLLVLLLR